VTASLNKPQENFRHKKKEELPAHFQFLPVGRPLLCEEDPQHSHGGEVAYLAGQRPVIQRAHSAANRTLCNAKDMCALLY
jgi:hypothetical protein